jgi:uncharacterized protein DUF6624
MTSALIVVLAFVAQSSAPPGQTPRSPELASQIESLFHTITTTSDDSADAAAKKEVSSIYASHGFPTVAEVGDEPSYEFIVLLNGNNISSGERAKILPKIQAAASRGEIPADAAAFFAARLRFEHIKELAAAHPPSNPRLRDEIGRMYAEDQAVRQKEGFDAAKMQQVDRDDSAAVQKILDQFGVPTFSMVGPEAAGEFVLMIQHQPAEFRARALPLVKANVAKGEADPDSFAKVYDRSQYDLGKPQLYGEQMICNAGEKLHEAPIEDPAHVNDRRAQLGLIRAEIWTRLAAELMPQFCPPAPPPN